MRTRAVNALEGRARPLGAPRAGGGPSGPAVPLTVDEIHVWRARLDAPAPEVVASLEALLSADERERARKFYFERDRRRFVVCRGILRTLLGSYLGRAPQEIAFHYGPNGKPRLEDSIFFNLAHSEDLALLAFTRAGEVGVDVERIREMSDWPSIAELSFSPEERERLRACPAFRRREEFFHAWTRQEALPGFQVFPLEAEPGFAAALALQRSRPTSDFS